MKIIDKIIKLIGRLAILYTTIYSMILLFMLVLAGLYTNLNILAVILVGLGILRAILCIKLLFILYEPDKNNVYIVGLFTIILMFVMSIAMFNGITIEGIDFNNAILPVLIALLANWIDSSYIKNL
ncbi:hypothetical protein [Paraclostridium sordellii]|uniref:hypothetical protein n=1 Tax=Paraclostridium sordellii TaxID=1505 RepID=UPI000385D06B|nr:hypothetical protein [Paeniclostridium sordellii]EPZ57857.1 putative membrane protein [[Clostridium] sordellii VPI 9048] [Paeniclostridium sordellii VPI 9048]CEK37571.1 hypothetical protein JGS6382_09031 [[Clostridium] sordellii] [Paeniclostridium sordellii]